MSFYTILKAIILGIIEGGTEFIPVSSTGHLIFAGELLKFNGPVEDMFKVVIQFGSILSVCWLYRKKLFTTVLEAKTDQKARQFLLAVFLAFLPAAVLGMVLHDVIANVLFSPKVVAVSLIVGGLIMIWVEKFHRPFTCHTVESLPLTTALKIGLIQTLAMIPGLSRSGATIIGAMVLGVDRKTATEFSFFLAIPTILGASSYDLIKNYDLLKEDSIITLAVGFITAFIVGLIVVQMLLSFVGRHNFLPFAYYRLLIGGIMILMFF